LKEPLRKGTTGFISGLSYDIGRGETMATRFGRENILNGLHAQITDKKPILLFGAGTGLTAKSAEMGGADIIAVYSTAIYRMQGLPSLLAFLPYSDANEHIRNMASQILPVVTKTPCIAGIGAHDPALDLPKFMEEMLEAGFSGFTNEPFAGIYGPAFAEQLEAAGIGFSREVALIQHAREMNTLAVAWTFTPEEAETMAEAGADIIGAHVGVTAGGSTGAAQTMDLHEATAAVQSMCEAAKRVNPDIIVVTHGGPFKDPTTAEYSIVHSDAAGYAAGSSGERMPVESAVSHVADQYKNMKLK
jgi:predicted TIM-barrel enzyme